MHSNRRQFLKGLGGSALALPLATMPWARVATAQGAIAKRAVFMYIPDGCIPERFHPTGGEFDFQLNEMTSPLESVRQHCLFASGLNMYEGGHTHEGGVAKVLTGNHTESLDYFLAQRLGSATPFKSMNLGVAATFQNGEGNVFNFSSGNVPITPNDNPINAFDTMFGGGGNGGGEPLADRRKRSILDRVLADLNAMNSKLGQNEREKLEFHTQSLREVESRILDAGAEAGVCNTGGFNSDNFTVPEGWNGYPPKIHLDEHYQTIGRLQMDLITEAFSCDMTRVASLMWSHPVSPLRVEGIDQGHHDTSHYGNRDSDTADKFVQYKQYHMRQFRYLIENLASRTDTDGNSLLHNTVIFLCSELGDSNAHDHRNMPFILAGNAGGALQTGRYVDFAGDAHSKLLVSIANMLDVNIDSFGYTGHGTGGLPGLLA
ncbi:DUF1552 domain-containing protein [Marinobacter sp. M1N3S26]|uniref:DUF1552 domain-containing protein n=1 Tax=Marinobacter sp. M1N3S26 TaxID=3382299 RepID=UPI00387B97F0